MSYFSGKTVFGISLVCLCVVAGWAQQEPPPTEQSPLVAVSEEQPFTNAEVVKLCTLEFGDEVVIAKINQVKQVDFQLDTDSLIKLKEQGVSKDVIAAMLNRVSQQEKPATPAGPASGAIVGQPPYVVDATSPGDEGVLLRTSQGELRLQSVMGDLSTTYAVVAHLMFLDFQGLTAETRLSERRPTIVVRSSKSPRGRVFLVKCDQDKDDSIRSVKLGKVGMFSSKSWSTPDNDWTVECDNKQVSEDTWELTPKKDLLPGEYGVLFRGGFYGALGGTQGELFDFGVD